MNLKKSEMAISNYIEIKSEYNIITFFNNFCKKIFDFLAIIKITSKLKNVQTKIKRIKFSECTQQTFLRRLVDKSILLF